MTTRASNYPSASFQFALARRSSRLGLEEELVLGRRWRDQRDRNAADILVRAHLRTVTSLAAKYRYYGVPIAELVAEGNWGLVHALRKFDPERGVRFATYAAYWVRAQMLGYIIRTRSIVAGNSGPMRSELFFKLHRERARAAVLLGEGEPGYAELGRRMGVPVARVEKMIQRLDCRDVSLDVPGDDDASSSRLEGLASGSNPEDLLCNFRWAMDAEAAVGAAIRSLDPRERYIVKHRLMADRAEELSLAELGCRLGVSRERVRQLEMRAKRKLKRWVESSSHPVLAEWANGGGGRMVSAAGESPATSDVELEGIERRGSVRTGAPRASLASCLQTGST
jgi:RNA polymerase sigma-32 factor